MNLGYHYIIDFTGCDPLRISKVDIVKQIFNEAAIKSKATIITDNYHQYSPEGVSGVILIAESHFTIHTWPERGYAAVDIFTCGKEMDVEAAISEMKEKFLAKDSRIEKISRGIFKKGE